MSVPKGYYAVPDPDDPGVTTCWRYAPGSRRPLSYWKKGAFYGKETCPSRGRPPRPWTQETREAGFRWGQEVWAAIAADPDGASQRFAQITSHCGRCGREIYERDSILAGFGPECRKAPA